MTKVYLLLVDGDGTLHSTPDEPDKVFATREMADAYVEAHKGPDGRIGYGHRVAEVEYVEPGPPDDSRWHLWLWSRDKDEWVSWTTGTLEDVMEDALDGRLVASSGPYTAVRVERSREG